MFALAEDVYTALRFPFLEEGWRQTLPEYGVDAG